MPVNSFQITVPRKIAAGQLPIMQMKATVSVVSDAPVSFSISDPRAVPVIRNVGPLAPGSAANLLAFDPVPPGAVDLDALTVTTPAAALPAGDPLRRRYVFFFELNSDFNAGAACATTMAADETWTLQVTAGPQISSVCLQSFDRNIAGQQCTGNVRPVPLTEPVATVVGVPGPNLGCLDFRPGLDVVLVLDQSGSMSGSTLGTAPQPKIQALHDAVSDFVTIWNGLRTSEGVLAPTDHIGVALFNHNAGWWVAIPAGLNDFAAQQATILANVNSIAAGGATSIGDGLLLADSVLNVLDNTRRRVILLMSNGMQNTDQMVGVLGGNVVTYPLANPANTTNLPNQANYQIYSVTVGTSAAVSAQINQDVAIATQGFYINSEDDADLLSPFFLELLQNFIKFNSWEVYRLVHDTVSAKAPYSTNLPVTTTTQHLAINLRWVQPRTRLRLRVTPPGEPPTEQVGSGNIVLYFDVPTSAAYDYNGDWQLAVEIAGDGDGGGDGGDVVPTAPSLGTVAFDLVVLGEDATLTTDMTIVAQDYVPGSPIQFEARPVEFGRPLTRLGSGPDERLVVQVVRPGIGIGDLLSDSTASTRPPFAGDATTPADARLYNQLQANPQSLLRDSGDLVTLVDDGTGVYRGSYPAQAPGHYNFLFGLTGRTRNAGDFSRQQLKTVYVRPAPAAATTNVQTSLQTVGGGNQMVITMTPKTQRGDRLGPGWGNYFWFTAPGRTPFKAQDNLDGSYTARLLYNSLLPPSVTVHFLPVSMIIGDTVTADKLPVPLDSGNVLVPFVNPLPFPLSLPLPKLLLLVILVAFVLGVLLGLLL
jgi:hypothetical protein